MRQMCVNKLITCRKQGQVITNYILVIFINYFDGHSYQKPFGTSHKMT